MFEYIEKLDKRWDRYWLQDELNIVLTQMDECRSRVLKIYDDYDVVKAVEEYNTLSELELYKTKILQILNKNKWITKY